MATRLKNYYAVLELEPFTEAEDIKQAFRRLARKVHPDLNGGTSDAQEKFKAINEAYEILGHPEKKLHYDLTLRQILQLQPSPESVKPQPSPTDESVARAGNKNEKSDTGSDSSGANLPLSSILEGFLKGRAKVDSPLPSKEKFSRETPTKDRQAETPKAPTSPENSKPSDPSSASPKTPGGSAFSSSSSSSGSKPGESQSVPKKAPKVASKETDGAAKPHPPKEKPTQVRTPFPTPQDLVGNTPLRGEDVTVETTISPAEAEHGVIKTVNVQHNERCKSCSGTGRLNGLLCPTCHGDKMTSRIKKLDVRIPSGVKTGSRVRVAGEGGRGTVPAEAAGTRGKPLSSRAKVENGDLYLLIRVIGSVHKPPPKNTRTKSFKPEDLLELDGLTHVDGLNVHVELSIPIVDAVLGCERLVPTLHGEVRMTIPPLTSSGKVLRLKQQGLTSGGQTGDQLVTLQLYAPQSLTEAEKRLYEALRSLGH